MYVRRVDVARVSQQQFDHEGVTLARCQHEGREPVDLVLAGRGSVSQQVLNYRQVTVQCRPVEGGPCLNVHAGRSKRVLLSSNSIFKHVKVISGLKLYCHFTQFTKRVLYIMFTYSNGNRWIMFSELVYTRYVVYVQSRGQFRSGIGFSC